MKFTQLLSVVDVFVCFVYVCRIQAYSNEVRMTTLLNQYNLVYQVAHFRAEIYFDPIIDPVRFTSRTNICNYVVSSVWHNVLM